MDTKIKFVVVGYGHIGKRHAELILGNPSAELVAICDTKNISSKTPTVQQIADLASIDFDVACICTPNGLHAEQSIELLNQGKHIVCEKPFALNSGNAQAMIEAATQNGKHIFPVMQNRYSPPSQWLKEIVDNGVLGAIHMVQFNCFWNRDERYYTPEGWRGTKKLDGGVLYTQFSHFIDLLYWVFGDVTNIQSSIQNLSHEGITDFADSGNISFDLVNGGMGSFNFSTSVYDQNLESSVTILAENGTIKIGGQYMDQVEYCHIKDYTFEGLPPANQPNDYGTYKGSAANHGYIIDNVIGVLANDGTPDISPEDGLKVVGLIERMYLGN